VAAQLAASQEGLSSVIKHEMQVGFLAALFLLFFYHEVVGIMFPRNASGFLPECTELHL
jgi:hypothetical protein